MGYRSDVYVAFEDSATKRFVNELSAKDICNFLGASETYRKDGWTLFFFSDVKWYDDYSEVKSCMSFIDKLEDDYYEYHCLGEDSEDYEYRNSGVSPFHIHMSRSIDFDPE